MFFFYPHFLQLFNTAGNVCVHICVTHIFYRHLTFLFYLNGMLTFLIITHSSWLIHNIKIKALFCVGKPFYSHNTAMAKDMVYITGCGHRSAERQKVNKAKQSNRFPNGLRNG